MVLNPRMPDDVFAEPHPEADFLMLKCFMCEAIIEMARGHDDPAAWVDRFIEQIGTAIDWQQEAMRDRGQPENEKYDLARVKLERRRGWMRTRAAMPED